jgi:signal peptidase I
MKPLRDLLLGRTWKGALVRTLIAIIIIAAPLRYHYRLAHTSGNSMVPTYSNNDVLIIQNKRSLGPEWSPDRFDVVIIDAAYDHKYWTKRVIALPGETVKVIGGIVYINDVELIDPYRGIPYILDIDPVKIPEHHFWVIGDDRESSEYGVFHTDNIIGKVIL